MHINYSTQTDEQLVELYQTQNDQEAFDELFNRYRVLIETKTQKASNNTGVDYNVLLTQNLHRFWRTAKKYNPARGCKFRSYLFWKFKHSTHDAMKGMYRNTSNGRVLMETIDQRKLHHLSAEVDMDGSLAAEEIYDYLRSKSEEYPIFLKMLTEGYTYEEIGRALKKEGAPAAIRMWGSRMKARIAKLVQEYYEKQGISIFKKSAL